MRKEVFWVLFLFFFLLLGKATYAAPNTSSFILQNPNLQVQWPDTPTCASQPPFEAGRVVTDGEILILDFSKDKIRGFSQQANGNFSEFLIANRDIEQYDFFAVANIDNIGLDEIILADASSDYIYIYDASLHEIAKFDADIERYDDLAAGDVNGDGKIEIILGDASDPSGKSIRVFNTQGNEVAYVKISDGYERHDRVDAGDVDGDGIDEIIFGDASDDNIHIYEWKDTVIGNLSEINHFYVDYSQEDEIAVGDVNGDGIDEIVFAEGYNSSIQDNSHKIIIYDASGNIQARSLDLGFQKEDSLAVGDIDMDGRAEMVIGKAQNGFLSIYKIFNNGKLEEIASFNGGYRYDDYSSNIAIGDFDGGSITVGNPVCKGQLELDNFVVAVINAPPKHNGVNNESNKFFAKYKQSTTQTTTNILKAITSFSFSAKISSKLNLKILKVESALKLRFNHSNTTEQSTSTTISIGQGLVADMRDAKVSVNTTYDVYEYPVLDDNGNHKIIDGEPQFLAVNVPVSLEVPTLGYYESSIHTLGDITSYPTAVGRLLNYSGTSIYDTNFVVGPDPRSGSIKKSDRFFNSNMASSEIGIGWDTAISTLGSRTRIQGDYSRKKMVTHQFEFLDSTELDIVYKGGINEENKYYNAHAVAYYDSVDGHFVLDWLVPSYGSHYRSTSQDFTLNPDLSLINPGFHIEVPDTTTFTLPLPNGENGYVYEATGTTQRDEDPSKCKPVDFADNNGDFEIVVDLPAFAAPLDVYLGIYAPHIIPNDIILITNGNALDMLSNGLKPWLAFTSGNIHEFINLHVPISDLPTGEYYFYLLASPANANPLENYYLWSTIYTKN